MSRHHCQHEVNKRTNDDSAGGEVRQLLADPGAGYDGSLPKVHRLAHGEAPLYLHAAHLHTPTTASRHS